MICMWNWNRLSTNTNAKLRWNKLYKFDRCMVVKIPSNNLYQQKSRFVHNFNYKSSVGTRDDICWIWDCMNTLELRLRFAYESKSPKIKLRWKYRKCRNLDGNPLSTGHACVIFVWLKICVGNYKCCSFLCVFLVVFLPHKNCRIPPYRVL